DLWITREWGTISLWRNEKGNLKDVSKSAGLGTLSGWWNGIAGGDLNHDGAIDYVVTNTGLNTKYHADPAHPARLYYGDMDGSGRAQIIEAKMEGDTWLPIRGKSCSQNAMPGIKNRFPTFKAFAGATLTEIYTPIRLEKAQSFNATELQSGTLLNDGKGNFTFHPLPRIAQISAGFGIALTEINGDGHPDLYIVQNDFSPQAETGRFDGGVSQLLMGKGDGTFTPVPTHESGLLVTGDGKSLGHIDLNRDGWVDFVAATNSGPILTFINRGDSTHRPLSFRVVGPAGNPTAIGTRLTLAGKGMPRQTAEIHGGGGYLSQQSGSLFFGVPSGGQPVALVVHWPDGSRSNVNLTKQKGKRLEIRHPSLKR
ncbi:MAG: CRTAC1 family protein, partial [Verrucomicrobiota bacterium]